MNPMDITGRSILLTGSGIGRSLALGLAPKDVRLVLVGRHAAPLEEVAEQVRAAGSQAAVVPPTSPSPASPRMSSRRPPPPSAGSTY